MANVCGTGGWGGPKPGDPDNNSILTASPAFGGIDVSWTYPTINPSAVAHILLYRGLLPEFSAAMQIAVASGNIYYDKVDTNYSYYYWIQIVSINGTVGELIGPASAIARPMIEDVIAMLTSQIDDGMLAQSLKTDIDRITLNYGKLVDEISDRILSNAALSNALVGVQTGLDEAMVFLDTEVTQRQEGQSALVSSLNTVAAANANNLAVIQQETSARVTADSALATTVESVNAVTKNNAAAILTEQTARTNADTALASQITTVQSSFANNLASAQTTLQTNINTVNGKVTEIGSLYSAKVTVNGLIGGFGVYNNGTVVDAGFDVDTFWVGRTGANKRKPFIISNGEVIIEQAVIKTLTFSKLRNEDGSVIVVDGKLSANNIDTVNLNVKGQVNVGSFTGYNWPVAGLGGAHLSQQGLLLGNVNGGGKYFQIISGHNSGGNAQILTNIPAYIEDLQVTTLKIANHAVSYVTKYYGTSFSLTVHGPSSLFISATAYLQTTSNCGYTIFVNGSNIGASGFGGGGNFMEANVAVSGVYSPSTNGSITVTLTPFGSYSRFSGQEITIIEVMK